MAKENKNKRKAIDRVIDDAIREGDASSKITDAASVSAPVPSVSSKKAPREKAPKLTKEEKKEQKAKHREKVRAQKEWEDSIVASKRVKREENRRKWKRAMLILLIFAMTVTSVVYVMLLFVQENNIRITASSSSQEKAIALSMDDVTWSPYINAHGPQNMTDISYNRSYNKPTGKPDDRYIPTIGEAMSYVAPSSPLRGAQNGKDFIAFGFSLLNSSASSDAIVKVDYGMNMTSNQKGLENAIRVMWAENFDKGTQEAGVSVYAAPSYNEKVGLIDENKDKEPGQYAEMVSYPLGSDKFDKDAMQEWYDVYKDTPDELKEAAGWFPTTPFEGGDKVFTKSAMLAPGEKIYVYVCVWIEGSDFECVDAVLGGYVSLSINFEVVA